jgi:hypothetical protein
MNDKEAINRARAVIRRQHKTLSTEQTYLHWLRHYIAAIKAMPIALASEQKVERFLTDDFYVASLGMAGHGRERTGKVRHGDLWSGRVRHGMAC